MTVQEEILNGIETIIQKAINRLDNRDASSVVLEIKNNSYKVTINGADYWIKDGVGVTPAVGTSVWIYIPFGNIKNAYICGLK